VHVHAAGPVGSCCIQTIGNRREISLYRTGPGETCLISVACHLRGEIFPVNVEVEEDVRMFQIPTAVYQSLMADLPEWKDFIINTLYDRLLESLQVIEEVAFSRVDHRLAQWLLEQSRGKVSSVYATHEGIATELGSAREVISRILGQFRDAGAVHLARGRIRVEKPDYLRAMIN
jgi:CRP/FNR family transcriptional regulator